jgi:hypothetical protein
MVEISYGCNLNNKSTKVIFSKGLIFSNIILHLLTIS